ncbi:hypothetical protein CES87_04245 [Pseudomonas sp. ERMR1:02]|nr:hypothetical protein CES87_04245 [Pseudomonas sp. ERMR1:02]
MIVPTLCVGMPQGTLRVPALERDAERPGLHSHAERGNDQTQGVENSDRPANIQHKNHVSSAPRFTFNFARTVCLKVLLYRFQPRCCLPSCITTLRCSSP